MVAAACPAPDLSAVLNGTDDRLARVATHRHARRAGIRAHSPDYEDALQDARIALLRAAETYQPAGGSSWAHYALVVVGRQLREGEPARLRRGVRFAPIDNLPAYESDPSVWLDRLASAADDPADLAARREEMAGRAADLRPALAALSPRARLCVRLHFLEGMNLREIAGAVGRTREAVRVMLAKAVAALRAALGIDGTTVHRTDGRGVWRKADDELAVAMLRAGAGCDLIGRRVGRTAKAVRNRLATLRAAGRL
jgi:RNA polymerase sigma factor (sigma-70 family)